MIKKILWKALNTQEQQNILKRPRIDIIENNIQEKVKEIIRTVKQQGDRALIDYTQKYDAVRLENFCISKNSLAAAYQSISPEIQEAIKFSIYNIEKYHQAQLPVMFSIETQPGVKCERQARPIQRVGLYVPGGSAPLVSTLMMLSVPARLAACPVRIMCTPPDRNGDIHPALLAAAYLCGINTIYCVGGAQAIAAMAYGTETIPKVDKIFGPGNAWVTQAKLQVSQDPEGAAIDLPAGPSELMVIADDSGCGKYIAADLLSQAEHGSDSQVFLVSPSEKVIQATLQALKEQALKLSRKAIIEKSLRHSAIIQVDSLTQALHISNYYAPEHLILQMHQAEYWIAHIHSAGAVFIGQWTPETVGDYVTGSNHVLPTYGYARSYSGLSVTDFMKFINIQHVSADGLQGIGRKAEVLAKLEGLTAHEQAVSLRLKDLKQEIKK